MWPNVNSDVQELSSDVQYLRGLHPADASTCDSKQPSHLIAPVDIFMMQPTCMSTASK